MMVKMNKERSRYQLRNTRGHTYSNEADKIMAYMISFLYFIFYFSKHYNGFSRNINNP